ncbi:MAG: hypothetical protein ACYDCJ_13670 [Gammaproteobacteria bacterium]
MPARNATASNSKATVDMLERAIVETRDSNRSLREAVELLHAAIFGRADVDPKRSLPGMQKTLEEVKEQLKGSAAQLTAHEEEEKKNSEKTADQIERVAKKVDRLRFGIAGGMAFTAIVLAIIDIYVRTQMHGIGGF